MDDLILLLSIISCAIVGIPILILIIQHIVTASKSKKKKSHGKDVSNKQPTPVEKAKTDNKPKPLNKKRQFPLPVNSKNYGEFKIYECLKDYEEQGCRFLFHLYLPINKEEITEIDALMISTVGIFVFESKNFKGYVRGGENDRLWSQAKTDEMGNSENIRFYNPIMQNNTHIRCLNRVLDYKYPLYSIVVFSEECVLTDDIDFAEGNTQVVSISDLKETVESFCKYMRPEKSVSDIETVYRYLYKYTQVSDSIKTEHIKNIQNKYRSENNIYK